MRSLCLNRAQTEGMISYRSARIMNPPIRLLVLFAWIFASQSLTDASENEVRKSSKPVFENGATNSGSTHWAFRPLARPAIPQVKDEHWARNPIDLFILARLEQSGLSPSPDAERVTLIRRLSFDLIGLPPTPDEVEQFVRDRQPRAYERLVERLLASPRYGERWARHWLDLVRFAESHGFEMNQPRPNAWPYRDYVIRAFNEDKPYNEFIIEQLAGDTFGVDEATGFLVGGPWDQVKSPDINLTLQQRMDELNDMINTTGTAFLGLTVGCARCHDHKFDPISQNDYYAMQAVFAGVQHGERTLRTPDRDDRLKQAAEINRTIEKLDEELIQFAPLANPAMPISNSTKVPNPKSNVETFPSAEAKFVRFTIYETLNHAEPCLDELEVYRAGEPTRNVALASAGAKATASGTLPNFAIHKIEHLNDGKVGNDHSWISNEPGRGWVQIEFAEKTAIDKIIWSRDREEKFKDRLPSVYSIEIAATPNVWRTVAGHAPMRPPVHPKINVDRFRPVKAKFLRFTILESNGVDEPGLDELAVFTAEETPRNIALQNQGTRITASGVHENSERYGPTQINNRQTGHGSGWISNQQGKGWVQLEFSANQLIDRVVWSRDRSGKFSDRLPTQYEISVASDSNRVIENSKTETQIGGGVSTPSQSKAEDGNGGERASAGPWQVVASSVDRERFVPNAKIKVAYSSDGLSATEAERLAKLTAQKKLCEAEIKKLTAFPVVYAGKFESPGLTHRLNRGEANQPREIVRPGGVASIGPPLDLSTNSPDQQRRKALASWIIAPENPLAARVMANRIWQYHFGRGIVDTPSDFGVNGARPSHPELLDWLAGKFVESGWSVKALHRLIVMSSAYRQSSRTEPKALAVDANDTLLWRFNPARLEAEALRDAILSVSGNLDLKMGGPGFDLFEPNDNYVRVYNPKEKFGPPEWRRMVYQFKPRMRLDDVFGAFDCPDAGQIAPKRTSSTTPLQALNLLNSPFILQQARIFGDRLLQEAGAEAEAQVRRAFRLCFSREASAREEAAGVRLIHEQGVVPFCRALFNANEFIYVF